MPVPISKLEYRLAAPELAPALGRFFEALTEAGAQNWFHPHPLTAREAERICSLRGQDLYYLAVDASGEVLAYGMLRGWDEGWAVPSLGIAVRPRLQAKGLGRALMLFLHAAARERGAAKVRLTVYAANAKAHRLFASLGYRFEPAEGGRLVGFVDL